MKKAEAAPKKSTGFSAEEKAAAKERVKELKAEARLATDKDAGEKDLQAKIAEMPEPDRSIATRLDALIKAAAPNLMAKTWYGQPAYATKEGQIVCFFQNKQKFGIRYATFGFNESAHLDDGDMWPVAFALNKLTPAVEKQISALVKKAVS